MHSLPYLAGYPDHLLAKIRTLIETEKLGSYLLQKYPNPHDIRTDKALYEFIREIKEDFMRKSQPLAKVSYDNKLHDLHAALGTHTFVSRVQGGRLKAKNEIRIAALFKSAPEPFLRMIAVHELAHLKEKEHNKAFYQLCEHMEPDYHQLVFDLRLYLTYREYFGKLY